MAETKTKKVVKKASTKKAVKKAVEETVEKTEKKAVKKTPRKRGAEFAVIFTGGKQYKVHEGDIFTVEKLDGIEEEGAKIVFDKVLLTDNGKETKIGDPYIKSAKVEAELVKNLRTKKINVIHYRSKSRHFVKKGHRQHQAKVKITKL